VRSREPESRSMDSLTSRCSGTRAERQKRSIRTYFASFLGSCRVAARRAHVPTQVRAYVLTQVSGHGEMRSFWEDGRELAVEPRS
jgi:hypothetical protein